MDAKSKKLLLFGGIGFLLFGGFGALGLYMKQTRSLKAKNPGSIDDVGQDYGAPEGLMKPNPDSRLLTFTASADHSGEFYGMRALTKQLYSTIFVHGNDTLPKLVHSWAPASDGNNEKAYVDFLVERTGLSPWTAITPQIFSVYIYPLALAIGKMEMGHEPDQPAEGWDPTEVASGISTGLQAVGLG